MVDRHDIYRTSVAWEGLPEPVQVVWRHAALPVTEVTLRRGPDRPAGLLAAAGPWMDLGRAPLLRVHVAAEPGGTGRWLALVQIHHLLQDHTALELVLGEMRAFLAGRRTGCPRRCRSATSWPRPGWACRGRSTSGTSPGLLGDVTEPTAPFGLLDVHGDGTRGRARPWCRWTPSWPPGCGSGPGARACLPRRCSTWPGRGCWRRSRAGTTWCSAPCCSAG